MTYGIWVLIAVVIVIAFLVKVLVDKANEMSARLFKSDEAQFLLSKSEQHPHVDPVKDENPQGYFCSECSVIVAVSTMTFCANGWTCSECFKLKVANE